MVRIIIFFLFLSTNLFSQSTFQTWPTISLKGEVIDNLDVKFKYRNKYDHKESSSVTSWFNMGLEYKSISTALLTQIIFFSSIP